MVALARRDVRLRPLTASDRSALRVWLKDMELLRYTVQVPSADHRPVRPFSRDEADRYLDDMIMGEGRVGFAIELDGRHVGNVGLKHVDMQRKLAECFIEIGERTARGRGVGERAMVLLLEYAFFEMGLVSIFLGVFEFNLAAIKMYRRLGFVDAPRYGDHFVEGRRYAVLGMMLERRHFRRRYAAGRAPDER